MSDEQMRISITLIACRNFNLSQKYFAKENFAFCSPVVLQFSFCDNCAAIISKYLIDYGRFQLLLLAEEMIQLFVRLADPNLYQANEKSSSI